MIVKPWTIGFYVDGERRDSDAMPIFTFWTRKGADECARRTTISHRNMYGDLHHNAGKSLEYRAVRR